jgi:hypothetical protein
MPEPPFFSERLISVKLVPILEMTPSPVMTTRFIE